MNCTCKLIGRGPRKMLTADCPEHMPIFFSGKGDPVKSSEPRREKKTNVKIRNFTFMNV